MPAVPPAGFLVGEIFYATVMSPFTFFPLGGLYIFGTRNTTKLQQSLSPSSRLVAYTCHGIIPLTFKQ